MKDFAQIFICIVFIIGFIHKLYIDTNGRSAKAPGGFSEVMATILATIILLILYNYAGLLDWLL